MSPTLDLVTSPPALWLRPEDLPAIDTLLTTWSNGAGAAAVAALGNSSAAAALAASFACASAVAPSGHAPYVALDDLTGWPIVHFTASLSTNLLVSPTALDLSSPLSSFAMFIVARVTSGTLTVCPPDYPYHIYGAGGLVTGRVITVSTAAATDWALGWDTFQQNIAFVNGETLGVGAVTTPSTSQWTLYTLTRNNASSGAGELHVNGGYLGAGSTSGPSGISLGGSARLAYNGYSCEINGNYASNTYLQWSDADIGEVLVFNRTLSFFDVRAVELWLGSRWGISPTPSGSPSLSPSGTAPPTGSATATTSSSTSPSSTGTFNALTCSPYTCSFYLLASDGSGNCWSAQGGAVLLAPPNQCTAFLLVRGDPCYSGFDRLLSTVDEHVVNHHDGSLATTFDLLTCPNPSGIYSAYDSAWNFEYAGNSTVVIANPYSGGSVAAPCSGTNVLCIWTGGWYAWIVSPLASSSPSSTPTASPTSTISPSQTWTSSPTPTGSSCASNVCYEAYLPNYYGCGGYASCGYTCVGNYCSRVGCSCSCNACAVAISGAMLDPLSGRCVPCPSFSPSTTPSVTGTPTPSSTPPPPVCAAAGENSNAVVTCPAGTFVTAIVFASFGTPTGVCGSYALSGCNAADSVAQVASLCLGQPACSISATDGEFGDPCFNVLKHLFIQVNCTYGTSSASSSPTATPTPSGTPSATSTASSALPCVIAYSPVDWYGTTNAAAAWAAGYLLTMPALAGTMLPLTAVGALDSCPATIFTLAGGTGTPWIGHFASSGCSDGHMTVPAKTAGAIGFHPGPSNEHPQYQWTAPANGTAQVVGSAYAIDTGCGTTTDFHVFLNGAQVFGWAGSGTGVGYVTVATPSPFNLTLVVQAGDAVTFGLGFGMNGYSCDSTGLDAYITFSHCAPTATMSASPVRSGSPCTPQGPVSSTVIAALVESTCAVDDSTSAAVCWGSGSFAPVPNALSVAGGLLFRCVLLSSPAGGVACSGAAAGVNMASAVPASLAAVGGARAVTAGTFHACALLQSGFGAACWGPSDSNAVASATLSPRLAQSSVAAVVAGGNVTCLLDGGGGLTCDGDDSDGQLNVPDVAFTAVTVGGSHVCAMTCGAVAVPLCWGRGDEGQLAVPSVATNGGVAALSAGGFHTLALLPSGVVLVWGDNTYGQQNVPTAAVAAAGGAVAISAGTFHSCAALADSTIVCWGFNYVGQVSGAPIGLHVPLVQPPTPYATWSTTGTVSRSPSHTPSAPGTPSITPSPSTTPSNTPAASTTTSVTPTSSVTPSVLPSLGVWVLADEWSPCSAACGLGTQQRAYTCAYPLGCSGARPAAQSRGCGTLRVHWEMDEWGPCLPIVGQPPPAPLPGCYPPLTQRVRVRSCMTDGCDGVPSVEVNESYCAAMTAAPVVPAGIQYCDAFDYGLCCNPPCDVPLGNPTPRPLPFSASDCPLPSPAAIAVALGAGEVSESGADACGPCTILQPALASLLGGDAVLYVCAGGCTPEAAVCRFGSNVSGLAYVRGAPVNETHGACTSPVASTIGVVPVALSFTAGVSWDAAGLITYAHPLAPVLSTNPRLHVFKAPSRNGAQQWAQLFDGDTVAITWGLSPPPNNTNTSLTVVVWEVRDPTRPSVVTTPSPFFFPCVSLGLALPAPTPPPSEFTASSPQPLDWIPTLGSSRDVLEPRGLQPTALSVAAVAVVPLGNGSISLSSSSASFLVSLASQSPNIAPRAVYVELVMVTAGTSSSLPAVWRITSTLLTARPAPDLPSPLCTGRPPVQPVALAPPWPNTTWGDDGGAGDNLCALLLSAQPDVEPVVGPACPPGVADVLLHPNVWTAVPGCVAEEYTAAANASKSTCIALTPSCNETSVQCYATTSCGGTTATCCYRSTGAFYLNVGHAFQRFDPLLYPLRYSVDWAALSACTAPLPALLSSCSGTLSATPTQSGSGSITPTRTRSQTLPITPTTPATRSTTRSGSPSPRSRSNAPSRSLSPSPSPTHNSNTTTPTGTTTPTKFPESVDRRLRRRRRSPEHSPALPAAAQSAAAGAADAANTAASGEGSPGISAFAETSPQPRPRALGYSRTAWGKDSDAVPLQQQRTLQTGASIVNHGGAILSNPTIYFIGYGHITSSIQDLWLEYLLGLGGSNYLSVLGPYMSPPSTDVGPFVTCGGWTQYVPATPFPPSLELTDVQIEQIVVDAAPTFGPYDPEGIYAIVLGSGISYSSAKSGASFCVSSGKGECGHHNFFPVPSRSFFGGSFNVHYLIVGDPRTCHNPFTCGMTEGMSPNDNGDRLGDTRAFDAMVSVMTHEIFEAITDPELDTWFFDDGTGNENMDACAWQFLCVYDTLNGNVANVRLGDRDYMIQAVWSRSTIPEGCVLWGSENGNTCPVFNGETCQAPGTPPLFAPSSFFECPASCPAGGNRLLQAGVCCPPPDDTTPCCSDDPTVLCCDSSDCCNSDTSQCCSDGGTPGCCVDTECCGQDTSACCSDGNIDCCSMTGQCDDPRCAGLNSMDLDRCCEDPGDTCCSREPCCDGRSTSDCCDGSNDGCCDSTDCCGVEYPLPCCASADETCCDHAPCCNEDTDACCDGEDDTCCSTEACCGHSDPSQCCNAGGTPGCCNDSEDCGNPCDGTSESDCCSDVPSGCPCDSGECCGKSDESCCGSTNNCCGVDTSRCCNSDDEDCCTGTCPGYPPPCTGDCGHHSGDPHYVSPDGALFDFQSLGGGLFLDFGVQLSPPKPLAPAVLRDVAALDFALAVALRSVGTKPDGVSVAVAAAASTRNGTLVRMDINGFAFADGTGGWLPNPPPGADVAWVIPGSSVTWPALGVGVSVTPTSYMSSITVAVSMDARLLGGRYGRAVTFGLMGGYDGCSTNDMVLPGGNFSGAVGMGWGVGALYYKEPNVEAWGESFRLAVLPGGSSAPVTLALAPYAPPSPLPSPTSQSSPSTGGSASVTASAASTAAPSITMGGASDAFARAACGIPLIASLADVSAPVRACYIDVLLTGDATLGATTATQLSAALTAQAQVSLAPLFFDPPAGALLPAGLGVSFAVQFSAAAPSYAPYGVTVVYTAASVLPPNATLSAMGVFLWPVVDTAAFVGSGAPGTQLTLGLSVAAATLLQNGSIVGVSTRNVSVVVPATPLPTSTASITGSLTSSLTATHSSTRTQSASKSMTGTLSGTHTSSMTGTHSSTWTQTASKSHSLSATPPPTPTRSGTRSVTRSHSMTPTITHSATTSATSHTRTPTHSLTHSVSRSRSHVPSKSKSRTASSSQKPKGT